MNCWIKEQQDIPNAVGGILQNEPIMCGGNYLYGFTKEIIVVGKPEIQPFLSKKAMQSN